MNYSILTLILLALIAGLWAANRAPTLPAPAEVIPAEIAPSELDGVAGDISSGDLPGGMPMPVVANDPPPKVPEAKTVKVDPFLPVIEEEIRVLQAKIDAENMADSNGGGRKISGRRVTIQRYEKKMKELLIRRENILSPKR